ncbi:MAG: rod shape-determining protein RodA [Ignavibacteriae bacterium]|nr:rod shape-determining protein RodA [Ignavibacteriota bacterium]
MKASDKISDRFDFAVFIPVILLITIGLVAIYSSTVNHPTASGDFKKQVVTAIISLIMFGVAYSLPNRMYKSLVIPGYVISLLILTVVLFFGKTVYGAKSWLSIGPIGFQPSEFAKIGLIFFLAYLLTSRRRNPNNIKDFLIILAYSLLPIILIILEPDVGTAIVYVFIITIMLFWSGIDLFLVFVAVSPIVVLFSSFFGLSAFILSLLIVVALLFYFKRNIFVNITIVVFNLATAYLFDYGFQFLKPHQQKRIETFINPMSDPLGAGYNILQTQVAIGSGGILGKGFLEGNQTQLRFIPKQWTDFIYCVIGEEFGFLGSVIVIILFIILLFRLLSLASKVNDKFGSLIIVGTFALITTHFVINIGMNLGVAPVIGIPLPFLSYGGSSLFVNMLLLGVVLNFYKNRREHV